MNRTELAANVAASTSPSKSGVASAVSVVFETIAEALGQGQAVTIAGFGTFTARDRAARQGRNLRTRESTAITASLTPSFKAAPTLRDAVNRTSSWVRDRRAAVRTRHPKRCASQRQNDGACGALSPRPST